MSHVAAAAAVATDSSPPGATRAYVHVFCEQNTQSFSPRNGCLASWVCLLRRVVHILHKRTILRGPSVKQLPLNALLANELPSYDGSTFAESEKKHEARGACGER